MPRNITGKRKPRPKPQPKAISESVASDSVSNSSWQQTARSLKNAISQLKQINDLAMIDNKKKSK